MKIPSVADEVSGVAEDDFDCIISEILRVYPVRYKGSFFSRDCDCRNYVGFGS